ncbi:MAG: D-alanyl-D-alanine carboxypeptidase [Treponema sp.]|jgi:D-alanyl-D-alanine carboxypeptidase (penicillin-binding protein 5/6)|nr:D-alanyl-D-alanine carboxypeptidase [Treponema sp.]
MKNAAAPRLFLALALLVFPGPGRAGADPLTGTDPLYGAAALPALACRSAALVDGETGTVLFSRSPSLLISPASLTKIMTMHLTLRDIRAGRVSEGDVVALPPEAWAENQPPRSSLMFLDRGQRVTLGEILMGLAVSSGNDAAVAAALHLAPSLESFVAMMNAEAGRLGLASTRFTEPAGISPENTTTAMDLARFCAVYLKEHPGAPARFHSAPSFAYPLAANIPNPRTIVQYNRNTLLGRLGVDGLKTGHITEAGYNIALSARRDDTRLVAVLLGSDNEDERDRDGEALLRWGFDNFKTLRYTPASLPPVRVWGGRAKYVPVRADTAAGAGITADTGSAAGRGPAPTAGVTALTVPVRRGNGLRQEIILEKELKAPLLAGSPAGTLILRDSMGELARIPLSLEKEAPRGGFFRILFDSIALFFSRLFGDG